jgi:hypothetical protein
MATGRRLMFFATRDDLLLVLGRVEHRTPLTYRLCVSDTTDIPTWASAAEIPDLGRAREGAWNDQPAYLVMPTASRFALHERDAPDGRTIHRVYPAGNPDSAVLYAGGQFSDAFVLLGDLAVALPKPPGFDPVRAIRRAMRAEFEWVPDSFVGPGARSLAEGGARLVGSTRQSPTVDFKLPKGRSR